MYPCSGWRIPDTEQLEWDSLPYTLLQDYGELNRRKENGLGELLEQENVQYQIETYEIASLGNEIRYKEAFGISAVWRDILKRGFWSILMC